MTQSPPAAKIAAPAAHGFSAADWDILSRHWFPVAVADELETAPMAVRLLDVDLVLFRDGEAIVAAPDACPHRGMRLSKGSVSDGTLVCPYHGLAFNGQGRCVAIPSQPDAVIPDRLTLAARPCVERFGLIWTSLAGDDPVLPAFEAWDDPAFGRVVCPPIDIAGSAGRQVEGFLDVAHFAFAHLGTFGDPTKPVVPDYGLERTETGVRATYVSDISNFAPDQAHRAPDGFLWRRTFEVFPPFSARLVIDYPDGKQLWILNTVCPSSARQVRMFCPQARDFDLPIPVEAVRDFNLRIFNEDRVMVENQRPLDLPLDLSAETHIAADRTSIAYRRLLKQMGLSLIGSAPEPC